MFNYFIKTPSIIQRIFKNYTWSFSIPNQNEKTIYLTFDDGPTPEITQWTLNQLKEFNAKATFFCIGKNIKNHPAIFKKIIDDKHAIGNHTNNHLNGWKNGIATYLKDIENAENIFKSQISNTPRLTTNNQQLTTNLLRPPYGKIKSSQAKQLINKGYRIIMWNVLSADFDQSITKEKCLDNVLKNAQNGSIIVLHDSLKSKKNMKYVLPKVLSHFSKKGFTFRRID